MYLQTSRQRKFAVFSCAVTTLIITNLGFSESVKEEKPLEKLAEEKFLLNVRTRYEFADQDGLRESNAFTVRTRIGYEISPVNGFKTLVELEDISIIRSEDNFNQAGLSGAGRTVIADIKGAEVNQAYLTWTGLNSVVRVGRQRIILDNARFVGNVGWRQNEQTYDAFSINNKSLPKTTLFYSYVGNVNRIFGDDHPAGNFDSDSHLINASFTGLPFAKLTGYAYLIDLSNSGLSSDTFGFSVGGAHQWEEIPYKVSYSLGWATQSENGSTTPGVAYDADYFTAQVKGHIKSAFLGVGYESLGSDNGVSFKTPLATLHAFNGWADSFLATPTGGLEDFFVMAGFKLPGAIPFKAIYHDFKSDVGGVDFGSEVDLVASYKINKHFNLAAKYTTFDGANGYADRKKFWLQLVFKY